MADQTVQGAPDLALITSMIRAADRLGLTWGLRPGTVTSVLPPYNPREASVRMDGDEGSITVVSLIDDLALGDRVMVVKVPPAGQYAIGRLNTPSQQSYAQASRVNTAAIVAETVLFTFASVTLELGSAYHIQAGSRIDAGAATLATFRMRKTNLAGAVVALSPSFTGRGAGVMANSFWNSYITPAANMVTNLVYTLQAPAPGAISAGTTTSPHFVMITLAGNVAQFPQAVTVS